jgi:hypothetical protein
MASLCGVMNVVVKSGKWNPVASSVITIHPVSPFFCLGIRYRKAMSLFFMNHSIDIFSESGLAKPTVMVFASIFIWLFLILS